MKPIARIVTTIAILLLVQFGFCQTGSIKGSITTSDGSPAEFVTVILKGTTKGGVANELGNYEINNVEVGSYILKTSYVGLESKEQTIEVKKGETTNVPTIILNENKETLHEIVIVANSNRYNTQVVSASLRLKTPLLELPQNIQLVSSATLRDQQIISMSDGVIRNVSGTARAEHWGDLYTNIVSRGSQIQAFRNGFNVVNSYWGPLTEDMSFVDHIEFVKGPAGFMLSSGDPSGLYNVVTKKPTGQNKGEVTFTYGSYDLIRASLDLDGQLNKKGSLLYRLNLSSQYKKSHRANEYNDRFAIAPVISYQLDERTKLTLEYNYQRANMSNVGSFYVFSPNGFGSLPSDFTALPSGTPGTQIDDHSIYLNLQHSFNDNWHLTAQLGRFIYDQEGYSMWPSSNDSTGKYIRNIGIWDALSTMTMGQVFLNGDIKTGKIHHRILSGIDMANKEYIADWGQSHDLDSLNTPFDPLNPYLGVPQTGYPQFDRETPLEQRAQEVGGLMDLHYVSFYIQDEIGLFQNNLRLTLAGRYTALEQSAWGAKPDSASRITPRLGLSANIQKNCAVYGLYDQAFIPQSGKLANGGTVRPITGNNIEFGIKNKWFDGKWNTTLAVYTIVKNNELTADPNSDPTSGMSIELGQKQSKGIEFDVRGSLTKGLHIIANYAYTDSKVTKVTEGVTSVSEGDIVPGFAKHTLNGWLTYNIQHGILEGFGFSTGLSYLSGRATYWEAAPDPSKDLEDYIKFDAGLFWENQKIRIALNTFNLLNEYLYSGSYESWMNTPVYSWQTEAPRNFRLSLNYRF